MPPASALLDRLRALSAVATTVAGPPPAAAPRACTCCSGRFEDPALLQQAADAIAGLDVGKLRAACTRSPAVRSEALRLAAELLPAALLLNMEPFMQQEDAVDFEDLPLPQELFFKFLQLEYDLCEALMGQLPASEWHRLLRALVPLVHGTVDASGYGYGTEYMCRIGEVHDTWEDIGGNYQTFFFYSEVEDEGVLDLIRQHGVQVCFEVWAEAARESWATEPDQLADKWLGRL